MLKIEELSNRHHHELTSGDQDILGFILGHIELCSGYTCEELAAACHISRTTVLRFLRRLGLNSFAELHYLLMQSQRSTDTKESIDIGAACSAYHRMVEELKGLSYDKICALIDRAETIYIYGTGNAQKAEAEELKRMLSVAGKCVIDLFDLGEVEFAALDFKKCDVFIIISLSGETPMGVTVLTPVQATGIQTLSITRWDNNTIARMCSHNLYVGTRTLHGYQNLSYEMTAAFYVLLDILFVRYLDYKSQRGEADEAGRTDEQLLWQLERK